MTRLPLRGPERLAAIRALRRMLADDMLGTGLLLAAEGWHPEDIGWVVDGNAEWLHGIVDQAHAEAAAYLSWAGVTS